MEVGPIVRLSVNDAQDISVDQDGVLPTQYRLCMLPQECAGLAALAYMLVWSWSEHLRAAEQLGMDSTDKSCSCSTKSEAHLHPRWQRAVVPAVLKVMDKLSDIHNPRAFNSWPRPIRRLVLTSV